MRHSKKAVFATFFALTLPVSTIALTSASADRGNSTPSTIPSKIIAVPPSVDGIHQMRMVGRRLQVAYHHRYLQRRHRRYLRHVRYLAHQRALAQAAAAQAAAQKVVASSAGTSSAPATSAPSGNLQAIAQCESGGNPSAIGGGGAYRGKYQFDYGTWASVGGSGDPAAAPEAEQDMRAAKLYAQSGSTPWPVCGR